MAFLRKKDYLEQIPEEHLDMILEQSRDVSGDPEVLGKSEEKSITRAKEYLSHRYKTNLIFAPFKEFDLATSYTFGDRINFEYDEWESSVYLAGEFVNYQGSVYERNANLVGYTAATIPTNATYFDLRGQSGIYYIAYPEEYNEDKIYVEDELLYFSHEIYKKNEVIYTAEQLTISPRDTNYFTRVRTTEYLTELTVSGFYPTNAAWTEGDNRNQTIVECIVNMTINKVHSIINPRNIPQLRKDNFSKAIECLKEFQVGTVNADLPDKEGDKTQTGYSIRFGSNEPTTHGY